MIKTTVTFNSRTRNYDVAIEPADHAYVAGRNVYWFDNTHQAIGCLLTDSNVGPMHPGKRRALIESLCTAAVSTVNTSFDVINHRVIFDL